jgi:hypothetical protein
MQQLRMLPASSGGAAQVFPLRKGLIDITTGIVTDPVSGKRPLIAHCVIDGSLTLTWSDTNSIVVTILAGDDFSMVEAETVEVTTGSFHFA